MVAIVIIAGVAAFYFWMNGVGNGRGYNPITDPTKITLAIGEKATREWRTYEVVGITPDEVEIVVEGLWVLESSHEERQSDSITVTRDGNYSNGQPFEAGDIITVWSKVQVDAVEVEPTPDESKFRASQIVGGIVSPFAGQNPYGYDDEGINHSQQFNDWTRSGWGVPYQQALESATWRLESSYAGGGDIDPLPAPQGPSTGADLDVDGFPQQGMDSFTGMPTDLAGSVDLSGSTSTSDISLTDLEVI